MATVAAAMATRRPIGQVGSYSRTMAVMTPVIISGKTTKNIPVPPPGNQVDDGRRLAAGLAGKTREHALEVVGPDRRGGASQVHGGGGIVVHVDGGDLPVTDGGGGGRGRGQRPDRESVRVDAVKLIGHQAHLARVADDGDGYMMRLGLVEGAMT